MTELIASLDTLANSMESLGCFKEAEQVDVYSNTLDLIDKTAWDTFEDKKNKNIIDTTKPVSKEDLMYSKEVQRSKSQIGEEFKVISQYLDRYEKLLTSEQARNEKAKLGADFPEKVINTLKDLRKNLIVIKQNLNVLEPNTGGLS